MNKYRLSAVVLALYVVLGEVGVGAAEQRIEVQTQANVMSALKSHIEGNSVDGKYIIYDAVVGKLKKLKFDKVHEGMMKNHGFYVSCADFVDDDGSKYDLDLLVADKGGSFQVVETVVHAINGKKRNFHLEDK
ncbi:MAG: hypothetical protein AAB308_17755 [Nitrospirota bacterium]|jgi:hypothetical protein